MPRNSQPCQSRPVNAVILQKPLITPEENPWQAVTKRSRRPKEPKQTPPSDQLSTGDSVSTFGAKPYAAATVKTHATTHASSAHATSISVAPAERLTHVFDKLKAIESTLGAQATQLVNLSQQQQQHSSRVQDLQGHVSQLNQQLSTVNNKVTECGMITGTFKNSIQHLEGLAQTHVGQIASLNDTLQATQARLVTAEARSQELHNSLQEQLHVQAHNLSLFTTEMLHRLGPSTDPSSGSPTHSTNSPPISTTTAHITPTTVHSPAAPTTASPSNPMPLSPVEEQFPEDFFIDDDALPPTPRRPSVHTRKRDPVSSPTHASSPSTREPPSKKAYPPPASDSNSGCGTHHTSTTLFDSANASVSHSISNTTSTPPQLDTTSPPFSLPHQSERMGTLSQQSPLPAPTQPSILVVDDTTSPSHANPSHIRTSPPHPGASLMPTTNPHHTGTPGTSPPPAGPTYPTSNTPPPAASGTYNAPSSHFCGPTPPSKLKLPPSSSEKKQD